MLRISETVDFTASILQETSLRLAQFSGVRTKQLCRLASIDLYLRGTQ